MIRLFFLTSFLVSAAAYPAGADCPCISSSSPLIQQAKEQFSAMGYPGYGTGGECRAYDKGLAIAGCDGVDPTLEASCKAPLGSSSHTKCYCFTEWCYVDPTTCPMDRRACNATGNVVGSTASVHCRGRDMTASTLIADATGNTTATAYYSYATCGHLDTYSSTRITEPLNGRNLLVKVRESTFWNMPGEVDERAPQWKGWTGALVAALDHSFRTHFDPEVTITVDQSGVDGWSTQTSLDKFDSTWTACVHDVAVGVTDMCIGDFWVTPQRMELANFLTPFDNDLFYLIAPRASEESFSDVLAKPFLPFSNTLWVVTLAFLIFSAIVMAVTDGHNVDDYGNQGKVPIFFKSLYFSFAGYVQGGSANAPASVPGRLATIGFGFFVLITLASYTANLATILVTKGSTGGITSAEDAISKGVKICIPLVVATQLESIYPMADFVAQESGGDIPAAIRDGQCGAGILSETQITSMHVGTYAKTDCGELPESKQWMAKHCQKDGDTVKEDRDCNLAKVGDLIMNVPLAVPVREDLAQSLGWSVRTALQEGTYSEKKAEFQQKLLIETPLVCGADGSLEATNEDPLESLRLPANSMLGTTIISIAFMMIALLLSWVEVHTGKTIQELLGCATPDDPDIAPSSSGAEQENKAGSRRALNPSGSQRNLMQGAGGADPRTQKIQNVKMDEMSAKIDHIFAKLCGDKVGAFEADAPPKGTQVVPLGGSQSKLAAGKKADPLQNTADVGALPGMVPVEPAPPTVVEANLADQSV